MLNRRTSSDSLSADLLAQFLRIRRSRGSDGSLQLPNKQRIRIEEYGDSWSVFFYNDTQPYASCRTMNELVSIIKAMGNNVSKDVR